MKKLKKRKLLEDASFLRQSLKSIGYHGMKESMTVAVGVTAAVAAVTMASVANENPSFVISLKDSECLVPLEMFDSQLRIFISFSQLTRKSFESLFWSVVGWSVVGGWWLGGRWSGGPGAPILHFKRHHSHVKSSQVMSQTQS